MIKRVFSAKETRRVIEISLIACGFALAFAVMMSGIS
jgi:hypothetical protein